MKFLPPCARIGLERVHKYLRRWWLSARAVLAAGVSDVSISFGVEGRRFVGRDD